MFVILLYVSIHFLSFVFVHIYLESKTIGSVELIEPVGATRLLLV